jgi:hypothetical protein
MINIMRIRVPSLLNEQGIRGIYGSFRHILKTTTTETKKRSNKIRKREKTKQNQISTSRIFYWTRARDTMLNFFSWSRKHDHGEGEDYLQKKTRAIEEKKEKFSKIECYSLINRWN